MVETQPEPGAVLDASRQYRYLLTREVQPLIMEKRLGPVAFIMLNPSTADETEDDPTIRKCKGYAARWGFQSLVVVNLFAYRTSSPKELKLAAQREVDIVGPDNWKHTLNAVRWADWIVCAWGNDGTLLGRGLKVRKMLLVNGFIPRALKISKKGQPYHPLYLKYDLWPEEWT